MTNRTKKGKKKKGLCQKLHFDTARKVYSIRLFQYK